MRHQKSDRTWPRIPDRVKRPDTAGRGRRPSVSDRDRINARKPGCAPDFPHYVSLNSGRFLVETNSVAGLMCFGTNGRHPAVLGCSGCQRLARFEKEIWAKDKYRQRNYKARASSTRCASSQVSQEPFPSTSTGRRPTTTPPHISPSPPPYTSTLDTMCKRKIDACDDEVAYDVSSPVF